MKTPEPPNINFECEVPLAPAGYYTHEQSVVNPARKDHFLFIMDLPCGLKDVVGVNDRLCHGGSLERLEFNIWGAVIPDIVITNLDVPFGGQSFAWSSLGRPAYGDINCSFTVDNGYDNYYILWQWLKLQNDPLTSARVEGINNYTTTISIFPLDEYKKPVAEFIFLDAFVTKIGAITKSTRDAGETESTFSFNFSQLNMKLV